MQLDRWEFTQMAWAEEPPFGYTRVPGWLPATVPGCAHLDLVANGIIKHPHEGMAELGCQWVDECDWSYRTRFEWLGGASALLRFEGLDTVCTIYLNGEEIGGHDNMFLPIEIDVSNELIAGENELRVDFQSAVRVGRERRAAYFAKHNISPDVLNFDERAFVRKAQYMFGWDWGPRLASCGIWKAVHLLSGGDIPVSARPQVAPGATLRRERDKFGESFEFIVDGKPLWVRGANWIPLSSFPCHYSTDSGQQRLRELLYSAKQMGMNMLRVWGGGFYESEEFYDACDLHEILVWQDFPFACSYSPDDDEFVEKVREEAIYHVKRLRHHKCLALWCGNNENLTMWEGKWGGADRQPQRFHGERIWNEVLRDVVAEHDPGRSYIPTSPIGGPEANSGGYGDQHYWDVWHGRGDWIHYADSTARFSSEFGFPSSCGVEAWKQVFPTPLKEGPGADEQSSATSGEAANRQPTPNPSLKGREPQEATIRWHDKTGRPYEYWLELLTKHYPEPRDLDEFVYYSQLNQRDAMRCAIEHYRRSEFCKGTLLWQLNDLWPALSWSLIDSAGQWKAAGHELERLYANELYLVDIEGDTATLWCIYDGDQDVLWASFSAVDSITGKVVRRVEDEQLELRPRTRRRILTLDLNGLDRRRTVLYINHAGGESTTLLCEPRDLLTEAARLAITSGQGCVWIECSAPVFDLRLSSEARLLDNFVSYPLVGKFRVRTLGVIRSLMARSLSGFHDVDVH